MSSSTSDTTPDTTPKDDMGELLDSFEPMKPLRRGDVVDGIVMRADPDGIFVNIGHKAEGVVPPGEMRTVDQEAMRNLKVGDEIMTLVVRAETAENAAILSIDKAIGEQGWRILEKAMEAGDSIEGEILGFNRGGAIVEAEGVQGFVPMSQLVSVSRAQIRETQEAQRAWEDERRDSGTAVEGRPAGSTEEEAGSTEEEAESAEEEAGSTEEEAGSTEEEAGSTEEEAGSTEEEAGSTEEEAGSTEEEAGSTEEEAGSTEEEAESAEEEAESAEEEAESAEEESESAEEEAESAEEESESAEEESEGVEEESAGVEEESAGAEEESESTEGEERRVEPAPISPDIGKKLELKVLEVNRGRNRAIFSERQAVQQRRDEQKARLIEELTEGEVRRGKVTGISNFGAFVDLGGADGLIHISELSWNQVSSPEEVVRVGEELDVFVLRVDAENKKIALSLRRLQPEPWDSIEEQYAVGDIVDATVTKLTNFGAFARVEGNEGSVEGLIHISELSSRMINHPREVVRQGDAVKLKILRIEPERRRLGLSLMQAQEEGEFLPGAP